MTPPSRELVDGTIPAEERPRADRVLGLLCTFYSWRLPVIGRVFSSLIKRRLHFPYGVTILPGFRAVCGNIVCEGGACLADTFFVDYGLVTIGAGASFSFGNIIITSTHDLEDFGLLRIEPVSIGERAWITTRVTILPGVRVGSDAVVGANSVVTRDVPSNVVVAGNPARFIGSRGRHHD